MIPAGITAALVRWGKFNLVGTMGFVVQIGALAALHRAMPKHDLYATALALEMTLLHNFVWHVRYTWRDREGCADGKDRAAQLLRFHLANGMVSLLGNLVMVKLLVQGAHWPLLAANATAILGCSGANFVVGNTWAFAKVARELSQN